MLDHPRSHGRQVHHLPPLPAPRRDLRQALTTAATVRRDMLLHRVGRVDERQTVPRVPQLAPRRPSTAHPQALGVRLDAWPIRGGRLPTVATVRLQLSPQGRILGPQGRVLSPQRRARALQRTDPGGEGLHVGHHRDQQRRDLCWLVRSSARSETPRPPHRGRLITARRGPVSRGSVHGSVPSFHPRMSEPASTGPAAPGGHALRPASEASHRRQRQQIWRGLRPRGPDDQHRAGAHSVPCAKGERRCFILHPFRLMHEELNWQAPFSAIWPARCYREGDTGTLLSRCSGTPAADRVHARA